MEEITKWVADEKSRLNIIAAGGDAVEAEKARRKLSYLAYVESFTSAPEIDVDALFTQLEAKFETRFKAIEEKIGL